MEKVIETTDAVAVEKLQSEGFKVRAISSDFPQKFTLVKEIEIPETSEGKISETPAEDEEAPKRGRPKK